MLHVLDERVEDTVPAVLRRGEEPCEVLVPVAPDRLAVQLQTTADGAERQTGGGELVDLCVASSNPFQERSLTCGQRWDGLCSDRPPKALTVPSASLLDGRREVLEEAPAICHLQRVRGGLPDGLGERHQAVSADDLGAGVLLEPGGDRASLSIGQHVHRPGGLNVDENGAVGPPLAEGELVDAEDPWGPCRHRRSGRLSQDGCPSAVEPQLRTEAGARSAAELHGDRPHGRPRRCRTTASWLGHARYLFHESPARAPGLIAEEPADAETDDQPVAADGEPGHMTPVPAVNASGGMLTLGTCSWRPAARRVDHQAVIRDHGVPHHKVQARERGCLRESPAS